MKSLAVLFFLCAIVAHPSQSRAEAPPPVDISGVWHVDGIYTLVDDNGLHECAPRCDRVIPLCHFEQNKEKFSGICTGPTVAGMVEGTINGKRIHFVWTHFIRSDALDADLANGKEPVDSGRNKRQVSFNGEIEEGGLIAGSFGRHGPGPVEGRFIATRQ